MSALSGIMSRVVVERTYTAPRSWGCERNCASACTCTRKVRPNLLKSLTYSAAMVLESASNTSCTGTPSDIAFSRSTSTLSCGTVGR